VKFKPFSSPYKLDPLRIFVTTIHHTGTAYLRTCVVGKWEPDFSELSTIERQTLIEGQAIFGSANKQTVEEGKEN
jgi:hypothetical protein